MVSEIRTTGPADFDAVDASADPGGLIRFLDAASTLPELRAAKDALMEQLAFRGARTALDVGCGAGGDVVELARLMPDGTEVSGKPANGGQSWRPGHEQAIFSAVRSSSS